MTMQPTFDDRDAAILAERVCKRETLQEGPRVGDWVRFSDGELGRFTHAYDNSIQTTVRGREFGLGSFYLGDSGVASYSGALDPPIPFGRLRDTGEVQPGRFWFFHHDCSGAHNGIDVEAPCRVYAEVQP